MNRFLGIQFRSHNHKIWFQGTAGILAVMTVITGLNQLSKHPHEEIYAISWALAFSSLLMSLVAMVLTRGGQKNNDTLSRDCIWYNFLLGCSYTALGLVGLL